MPIPLPDKNGREQILGIHLRKARDAGLVSPEVNDAILAEETHGFSGADLAGLVRSATSFAIADWRRNSEKPSGMPAEVGVVGGAPARRNGEAFEDDEGRESGNGLIVTVGNVEKALLEVGVGRRRGVGAARGVGALGNALRRGFVQGLRGG